MNEKKNYGSLLTDYSDVMRIESYDLDAIFTAGRLRLLGQRTTIEYSNICYEKKGKRVAEICMKN